MENTRGHAGFGHADFGHAGFARAHGVGTADRRQIHYRNDHRYVHAPVDHPGDEHLCLDETASDLRHGAKIYLSKLLTI